MTDQKTTEEDFTEIVAIKFKAQQSVDAWLGATRKDLSQEELNKSYKAQELHIRATKIYEKRQSDKRSSEIQSIVGRLRRKESSE